MKGRSNHLRVPEGTTTNGAPTSADELAIPVVTIPLAEYAVLLEAKTRIDTIDARARRYAVPPRSPIQVDAEIAAFFKKRFGKERVEDIASDCRERFGASRTPSRTAADAFWKRLRDAAATESSSREDRRGLE